MIINYLKIIVLYKNKRLNVCFVGLKTKFTCFLVLFALDLYY